MRTVRVLELTLAFALIALFCTLVVRCGGTVNPPDDAAADAAADVGELDAYAPRVCYDPNTPLLAYPCDGGKADCSSCPSSCTAFEGDASATGKCE